MKNIKTFESFSESDCGSREEMIDDLCSKGWDYSELEIMSDYELQQICGDSTMMKYESKKDKWIQDAIKNPGSLRRKMKKKKGENISSDEIDMEISRLKKKDKDPSKPGAQLSPRDTKKYKQLNLAKTLKGFK
jgi:hypothetical protein